MVANFDSDNESVLINNAGFFAAPQDYNAGDGTFAAAVNYATGNVPSSVTSGDVNAITS